MTSTHAANLRRMTQPWRGASRPWNDGSRRITDGSLLCQMKFRPPAPSARHQDGKADVVDQTARDAAQQDVTHPRMGEGADETGREHAETPSTNPHSCCGFRL